MPLNPVILYRECDFSKEELNAASKYFDCIDIRAKIKSNDLVIGRYSVLPYYEYLQKEIDYVNAKLINTYKQHRYVADLWNWYYWFSDMTPKTYNRLEDVPNDNKHSFVLKGETNSKKQQWNSHMFAKNKQAAINVYCNLQQDGVIGHQNIYIREYVPLEIYMEGLNGLPITKEFRIFICNGQVISKAFYWSNYVEDFGFLPDVNEIPQEFIQEIIDRVGKSVMFYAVDVAKTAYGKWIIIEFNDGQMSGLSCNEPEILYKNLRQSIESLL